MGRFKGKKDTGAANSSNLDLDPIKVLKRTSATVNFSSNDLGTGINGTSYPLSGFKTPYVNSSRWADIGKVGDRDWARAKDSASSLAEVGIYDVFRNEYDPYPAWANSQNVPITREEIEAIFIQLTEIFGFQYDNTRNMFDYLMRLLDSRACRMGPAKALRTIHADYIGGINANFKKWYFAASLDIDDTFGLANVNSNGKIKKSKNEYVSSLEQSESQWCLNMKSLSPTNCVIQVALYILCWGEANNIRFMPECLCFIFKCCNDYYYSLDPAEPIRNATPSFLDHAITPLYNFYRDQAYVKVEGRYYHKDKDHNSIIGYDDMNQLFWYCNGLQRIFLKDGKTKLMSLPAYERYEHLNEVAWEKAFFKTFIERRSWFHVFSNFNRIWIIHVSVFWYYTSFNSPTLYTKDYSQQHDNQPTKMATLSVMSLAGVIACAIDLISTVLEFSYVPRKWAGAQPLSKRLFILLFMLIANLAPSVYLYLTYPLNRQTNVGLGIATAQFLFSLFVVIYLSVAPLAHIGDSYPKSRGRRYLPTQYFAASFYSLKGTDKVASYGLWFAIFVSKFIESYFFLTLSLRDPIRELSIMKMTRCSGEVLIGNWLCMRHTIVVLSLTYLTDLVLFFLDTYLWYIVWNTIYSVCRSFYIGASIWTPWRNIFSRLPKRIFSKIIASPADRTIKAKFLVSQVWNSIIISMYREHLLSLEHVQKLLYKQVSVSGIEGDTVLKEPTFFVSQEDQSLKSALFYEQSEAQRRITFFAQSLSTPMPEVNPINSMPTFSVLIPHYSEKITLSLREIIREEEQYSHVTMLEYLKSLHPLEWSCFVRDTKLLAEEFDTETSSPTFDNETKDDLPYYSVGFKVATPEYILRTRIWASLRSQTLYRTISGFMNYSRAIKLSFDVENLSDKEYKDENGKLEEASVMALRKFRIVASMQRLKNFSPEERENKEFLLRTYPELQISYLDEEIDIDTGESTFYSSLIDGSCALLENGERVPKYRIKLSGNPILGDGKSDNQNNSLIFCRGEYIQLIDANQDNYLEECLKIRSVLAEFEENSAPIDPYSNELKDSDHSHPVAIIGTREYIFSENIGILGDVAAGKEQTFGTLFARTLQYLGGKLHYGHPDFLNGIFMTTRGGVSKAQKGLHLNEDIYAGMNAMVRGGRIKHCEYMQCGKGRDLGFGSILNFTTKIGAGMGEQMLSREYFYLSTQLPLDRFLSFYYAHPGFHLNNVFIILSIKLFLLVGVNLAALTNETTICEYDRFRPITDPRRPIGCYNLIPVVQWLERCIFSIFIVFLISFLPLAVQELTERGFYCALTRLSKHFASFSPLFEVFVCRIYAQSLCSDISIGGARYIATGRGFATIRVPFSALYSRFASQSLYFGAISGLLILYTSITMWKLPLLYFWVTVIGLLICPCLYNPNQFSLTDFFLDYGEFLRWLSRGNSRSSMSSWINYTRLGRSRIVGIKNRNFNTREDIKEINSIRPSRVRLILTDSIFELAVILVVGCAYLFSNSQNDTKGTNPVNSIFRILLITLAPIMVNMAILLIFFVVSILTGPVLTLVFRWYPTLIATVVHSLSVLNYVFFFELLWLFQNWNFSRTILGLTLSVLIQTWFLQLISATLISREFRHDHSNKSWWSGSWFTSGLGWNILSQPFREFVCKTTELSYFVGDLVIGHIILFAQIPVLLIPYADKWHSLMLFWLKPGRQVRPGVFTKKQRRRRRNRALLNGFLFIASVTLFLSLFILPLIATRWFDFDFERYLPELLRPLVQPFAIVNSRKGLHKGLIKQY